MGIIIITANNYNHNMFVHLWLRKGTFPVCSMNRYNGRHTGDQLSIDDDNDDEGIMNLLLAYQCSLALCVVDQSQWEHAT